MKFDESDNPGPDATALKIQFTELMQRIESLGLAVIGARSLEFTETANGPGTKAETALVGSYLNNLAATIYGGSSEIQRELIARNIVGI